MRPLKYFDYYPCHTVIVPSNWSVKIASESRVIVYVPGAVTIALQSVSENIAGTMANVRIC